jgi:hypothetical protein
MVKQRLQHTLTSSTNSITEYGPKTFKLLLIFNDHKFDFTYDKICLKTAHGFTLQKNFPHGFDIENGTAHVAPSLSPEALNSNEFRKQYKFLFSPEHLSLIQSTYFGDQGPKQDYLNKYPAYATML